MATAAQLLANQANAQHSTGPKTAEGKASSSRNNHQHGLTLGIFTLSPEAEARFCEFEAKLRAELKPEGAIELEAFQQFIDGARRLEKIRSLIGELFIECGDDPLVCPETEAKLRPLTRYRAAAEMIVYRAIKTLRELQTIRLFRLLHLTKEEEDVIPPMVNPATKIFLAGAFLGHNDRELFYHLYGPEPFTSRLPPLPPLPPDR